MIRPWRAGSRISIFSLIVATGAAKLSGQYDGALSPAWGAGDGFAIWRGSGEVHLETAVATNELLFAVGDYEDPPGTRSLHFQAVDAAGQLRADRSCDDATSAFGQLTDESGGEAAILDSSGNLLIGGWMTFQASSRLHALLARYEIDESGCHLDQSFSTDGYLRLDTQNYCNPESCLVVGLAEIRPENLTVSAPRTIVLLKATVAISNFRYFLVGLTTSGALDPGFGASGSGIREITAANLGILRSGAAIATDDYGRIVVILTRLEPGTTSDVDTMALRYYPDGTIDPSFGQQGLMAVYDQGIDDSSDAVAGDLLLLPGVGYSLASINLVGQAQMVRFDDEQRLSSESFSSQTAPQLAFQGDRRLLLFAEDLTEDRIFESRRITSPGNHPTQFDPTHGSEPYGTESYDVDHVGGTGQAIVDFLLWSGRPIVVGTAVDVLADTWGFLMRVENGYIFADGFEGGTLARWWRY